MTRNAQNEHRETKMTIKINIKNNNNKEMHAEKLLKLLSDQNKMQINHKK